MFLKILGVATILSAVAVGVMVTPKRPAPPKPEVVTIEFSIGGKKFTVTGTPAEAVVPQTPTGGRVMEANAAVR